jgi:hypothetical protein
MKDKEAINEPLERGEFVGDDAEICTGIALQYADSLAWQLTVQRRRQGPTRNHCFVQTGDVGPEIVGFFDNDAQE